MTQCNQKGFEFAAPFGREVVAHFDGGTMTSDSGALLLRETERRLNLLPRLAKCFRDERNASYISHRVPELLAQRVYGLVLLGRAGMKDNDEEAPAVRREECLGFWATRPAVGA